MQDIFKAMARAVGTDLTVLITGESGTGKELWRALHDLGSRRRTVRRDQYGGDPRDLVESELFGHEKGLRRADSRMSGRFEQAEGGSLFLDEVATCRRKRRQGFCAFSRTASIFPSGPTGRSRRMSGSSPPITIFSTDAAGSVPRGPVRQLKGAVAPAAASRADRGYPPELALNRRWRADCRQRYTDAIRALALELARECARA